MRLSQVHRVAFLQPMSCRERVRILDGTGKGPLAMERNMPEMRRVSAYEARDARLGRPDLYCA